MKRFIFAERNGIYIIDLQQSLDFIDRAYEFIKETVAHGGTVLYVGTKKQAQEAIAEQARRERVHYFVARTAWCDCASGFRPNSRARLPPGRPSRVSGGAQLIGLRACLPQ